MPVVCAMKNRACFALSAVAIAAVFGAPAHARTVTIPTQTAVVTPGSFIKIDDLDFGTIISGGTTGTVVVAPTGARTRTGGATLVGNDHHPAEFAGRRPGNGNNPVRISVGSNTIQLTGPGAPMTVRLFRGNTNQNIAFTTNPRNYQIQGQTNAGFTLFVGATLDVGANQTPGTYTGTWTITLDYQ